MKKKKTIPYAVFASAVAVAVAPVASFAQEAPANQLQDGLYFESTTGNGEFFSMLEWRNLSPLAKLELIEKYDAKNIKVYIETGNKVASLSDITEQKKTFQEVSTVFQPGDITGSFESQSGEIITAPEVDDVGVVVESVSAINDTVDVKGTLEFAINGQEKAADLEALNEAGYTVEFLASKDVFKGGKNKSTDGVVDAEAGTKFEYQVEITKGEEKYTSARQTVEVQDYNETVTAITKVETTVNSLEVADGKLALGDEAEITVKGTVKGNDKEQTLSDKATYKVDRPAVLTVANDGTVTPKAKGTATVTVTVGDKTEKVTYTVGDARKVDASQSTIDQSTVEVAAGKTAKVTVELKDQYGLAYDGQLTAVNAQGVTVLAEPGKVVQATDKDGKEIAGKYEITLTAAPKAATGDVVISQGSTDIGKVNVTVKEAGEVASYKLEASNTEFDLKTEAGKANKTLTLKAFDEDGLEVENQPTLGTGFELVSKDKNVATIEGNNQVKLEDTAKAGDKVTVIANKLTGAFKDQVAEIEITVVDSTPEITNVTFTSHETITSDVADFDLSELINVEAKASGSNETVTVAYEVIGGETPVIKIVEADSEVELGTVELTGVPADILTVKESDGKIVLTLGDAKPLEAQTGSLNVAVLAKNKIFVGDTNIDVKIAADTGSVVATTPGADVSVTTTLPGDVKIGNLSSLKISLLDDNDVVLATNELNELGFYLHGKEHTEDGFEEKTVVGSDGFEYTYKFGDMTAANGNNSSISTTFSKWRSADRNGIADATKKSELSAWNQSKVVSTDYKKVLVEYTTNGKSYSIEHSVSN